MFYWDFHLLKLSYIYYLWFIDFLFNREKIFSVVVWDKFIEVFESVSLQISFKILIILIRFKFFSDNLTSPTLSYIEIQISGEYEEVNREKYLLIVFERNIFTSAKMHPPQIFKKFMGKYKIRSHTWIFWLQILYYVRESDLHILIERMFFYRL